MAGRRGSRKACGHSKALGFACAVESWRKGFFHVNLLCVASSDTLFGSEFKMNKTFTEKGSCLRAQHVCVYACAAPCLLCTLAVHAAPPGRDRVSTQGCSALLCG